MEHWWPVREGRREDGTNPPFCHVFLWTRYDNIASLEMDMPEKTTQDFEGPGMVSRVDQVLGMTIGGDDGEDITFADAAGIPTPFLQHAADAGGEDGGKKKEKGERERDRAVSGETKPRRKERVADGDDAGSRPREKSSGGVKRRDDGGARAHEEDRGLRK